MTRPAYDEVPATILLVDDRPENLIALEAVLEPLGHNLLCAGSGEEALKRLLVHDVALILLDVQMPEMDGFETATRIKDRERNRDIPIIFLTAYSKDAVHAMQGFSHGAVDYVTKPFEVGLLQAKVRVFIELYQKTQELRRQSELLARRLDQRFETEARNLRKLAHAAVVINSTLSLDEILQVINDGAREVIGAHESETVITAAREAGDLERSRSFSPKYEGWSGDPDRADLSGIYSVVYERDEPVRMTKKEIEASFVSRGLFDLTGSHPMLEGWLAVPLKGRTGRMLGLIQVADKIEGDFTEEDEVVLVQLAQLAAVAIENAERYEHEHRIAETLQRSLLPDEMPKVPGLALAACYQPGSLGTQVGGDWYDVFPLDDGRVALVVGDVVGRGTRAAAVMGQLRTAIRAYAVHGLKPAELMTSLDRLLQELTGSAMATAVYVVVDLGTRQVEMISAGHPPPLLVPPAGHPRYLHLEPNVPLGTMLEQAFVSSTFAVEPGSVLVFFTDGLVESRTDALQDGLDRLIEVVGSAVEGLAEGVDGLCEKVISDMVPHRTNDDIAVLGARIS
ncbi:MAG TPA: SpoIIE family protein phosphatase [Acidimicrobiales bacterium]|nr:SpoIIE family protein phosphatase [Acidimicrobiales bacterium]